MQETCFHPQKPLIISLDIIDNWLISLLFQVMNINKKIKVKWFNVLKLPRIISLNFVFDGHCYFDYIKIGGKSIIFTIN